MFVLYGATNFDMTTHHLGGVHTSTFGRLLPLSLYAQFVMHGETVRERRAIFEKHERVREREIPFHVREVLFGNFHIFPLPQICGAADKTRISAFLPAQYNSPQHCQWTATVNQDGFEVNFNSVSEKFNQPISIFFDIDNNVDILHENCPPHPIFSMRSSSKSVSFFFQLFCYLLYC